MQNLIPTDKEEAIKKDIAVLQGQVNELVIKDDSTAQSASEFLGQIKARLKRIKQLRVELTQPFKDAVKSADNWFKTQLSPLESMEVTLKQGIGKYMDEKEKKALAERLKLEEEQRKKEEEAAKKAKAAEKKGEPAPEPVAPPAPLEPMAKPKSNIQTEAGLVSTSKRWTFEVTDESKVPRDYLAINSAAITAAIRNGEREIPGIKIFQKTSVSVR